MKKGQSKAKTSLKELLALHPEPKRNDWTNGRPNVPPTDAGPLKIGPDGFPEYDPKAFESGDDDDDAGPSAGGAFAVLAGLGGAGGGDEYIPDDDWVTVAPKQRKKGNPAPAPAASTSAAGPGPSSSAAAAGRRPAAGPSAPSAAASALQAIRAAGSGVGSGSAVLGPGSGPRAPYSVNALAGLSSSSSVSAPPRAPRAPTHGADGRPLSDSYYQTFQRVYRNANGSVCMRFHKTDVVVVRPNGDVVLTSGGYKTRTTFASVAEGLEPLGLSLVSSGGDGRGEWAIQLPDGSRLDWEDGMVVPAAAPEDRTRGNRLFAAYYPAAAAAAAAAAAPGRLPPPRPVAPPMPLRPPHPTQPSAYAAATSTPAAASGWSYRSMQSTNAAAAAPPPPYAPHLRPPVASAAPMPAPEGPRPAAPDELAALLEEALALQDAGGAGAAGGGVLHLDDEAACIVCMAAPKCTILIPCGHMVLCEGCTDDVMARSGECPMCRERVTTHFAVQS